MHGLVYEIFEHWAIHYHGLQTWHAIKEKAGCEVEDQAFVTRTYYRYETWVGLVNAASDQLGISSSEILESYGNFNIKYHFDNGYGALLKCQGSTLRQWLSNLNAMHDHVQKSFPGDNYCPPVFWCEDCDEVDGSILLHYTSKRGNLLVPWVVGIVKEIAVTFFEVEVKMHRTVLQEENGAASTTWRITAVNEAQRWKLSPSSQGSQKENQALGNTVDMPSGCPFSKMNSSRSSIGQHEPSPSFSDKCPFSGKQLKQKEDSAGSLSASTFPDYFSLSSSDEEHVGLTMKKLKEVFPFHVLVNQDFYVLQTGKTLPRLLKRKPEDFVNVHIEEILEVTRPNMNGRWNWKALRKVSDQHFFVVPKRNQELRRRVSISQIDNLVQKDILAENKMKFKVAMIQLSAEKTLFSLLPEVSNVAELESFGLTLSDLPLTTGQRDTVFLGEYVTQEAGKAHRLDKLSRKLKKEENLSNALLYSIIPKGVAEELRKGKTVDPEFHENVTLFFSDIVGFTKICDLVEPWDVIDMMNQLYSVMDFLVKCFNLYKVETVGDSYMCCSGLPEPDEYHAENVANFALAVVECVKHIKSPVDGTPIDLRIGIHTGSCTSGVVGTLTPHYCLFGDMVNTTSRHESTGIRGKIHCSSALFSRLNHFCKKDAHQYNFTARGLVDMKGKGENYTYWLDSGSEYNTSANSEALVGLYDEVKTMLSSKKWKMRRYFRKGGLFRQNRRFALSGGSSGASSGASSSSLGDSDSASRSRQSDSSCSAKSETSSVNSNDRDLEDDIEDDFAEQVNTAPIIDFSTEQLLHLNRNWEELQWDGALSLSELSSKVFDILFSTLTACVHKEGNRLEVMKEELRGYINHIAGLYSDDNAFHNFHHATQVFLRADFLWEDRVYDENNPNSLGKNPWDRFILLFSALIHDVKHNGVANRQLQVENHVIYRKHMNRGSYQERDSFDCALELLEEDFSELYEEIAFGCPNFRSMVRKVVLSTNLESEQAVKALIEKFETIMETPCVDARKSREQNVASIGMILAMAEVGHYSQGFDIFLYWNQRSLQEHLRGFRSGRDEDPRESWYYDQVMFFHDAVLPLISQVEKILPDAFYLEAKAKRNVEAWRKSGRELVAASLLPSAKVDGGNRMDKLVTANLEMLERLLQDVVASHTSQKLSGHLDHKISEAMSNPFGEIKLIIEMKRKSVDAMQSVDQIGPRAALSGETRSELRDLVITIASGYHKNLFHNFLHASHVAHLANLLLSGANEHDFACDPLSRFSIVLSALVHDVGHTGVPNGQLAEENPELATKFRNKSIAEQHSIVTAWDILMTDSFRNLHHCLFETAQERDRLRNLLVNCVMATDIFDIDLRALRDERWRKVFPGGPAQFDCKNEEANCKATVVTEHIMQASDVAHTMQEWDLYRQWNECLFSEMYDAYLEGRSATDPSDGWYIGELWFFDNWVIPLAQNLSECGVLDMVSAQLLTQAKHNRHKWEMEGEEISRVMLEKAKASRKQKRTLSSMSSELSVASEHGAAMLTSQIVSEVESLSKVVKRYERKMEAAVGTLIAVAYKGQPCTIDVKKNSTAKIHQHFQKQDWYRMYSDDEMSDDGSDFGSLRSSHSRTSSRRPARRVQVRMDNAPLVGSKINLLDHLSIAEDIIADGA